MNTRYILAAPTVNTNSLMLGVGSGLLLRNGVGFDVDYQWLHSAGQGNSQAIFLRVSVQLGRTAAAPR